jgi:hypothetical protein
VTDEQAIKFYEAMLAHYGKLPDPDHEQIQFAHCVKMYKYYQMRQVDEINNVTS